MLKDKCRRVLETGQHTATVLCKWERGSLGVISLTASHGMQKGKSQQWSSCWHWPRSKPYMEAHECVHTPGCMWEPGWAREASCSAEA